MRQGRNASFSVHQRKCYEAPKSFSIGWSTLLDTQIDNPSIGGASPAQRFGPNRINFRVYSYNVPAIVIACCNNAGNPTTIGASLATIDRRPGERRQSCGHRQQLQLLLLRPLIATTIATPVLMHSRRDARRGQRCSVRGSIGTASKVRIRLASTASAVAVQNTPTAARRSNHRSPLQGPGINRASSSSCAQDKVSRCHRQ